METSLAAGRFQHADGAKLEKQIWLQWRGYEECCEYQPSPKVTQHRTGPAGADHSRRVIAEEGMSAWLPHWRQKLLEKPVSLQQPEYSGLTSECPGGASRTCGVEGGDGKEADKNIKGH